MKNQLKFATNRLFYKTNRKLIAIASDDWGSVRIKSKKDRNELQNKGLKIDENRFDTFDSLESNKDLEELFEVLLSFKDFKGNHPIITAVFNTGNPNFEAIKQNDFLKFIPENLSETIKRYPQSSNILTLYKAGIREGVFVPESHGNEHIQFNWWINELSNKNSFASSAFENEFYFIPDNLLMQKVNNIQASFHAIDMNDTLHYEESVKLSVQNFEDMFGYKPTYFTPPSMFYFQKLEGILKKNGFKYLDVEFIHKSLLNKQRIINYLGKDKSGLKAIVRNNVFETNLTPNNDGVEACLSNLEMAFKFKQAAIISNHRVSFVGEIDEHNRTMGLRALKRLLKEILNKWPDVEFVKVTDVFKNK